MEQITNERSIVLTRQVYYQIVHHLWRALPPPVSDHPDDRVYRDNAAMAEVASLLPADPAEAELAGQFVAACAQAMDCLRLVKEHRAEREGGDEVPGSGRQHDAPGVLCPIDVAANPAGPAETRGERYVC